MYLEVGGEGSGHAAEDLDRDSIAVELPTTVHQPELSRPTMLLVYHAVEKLSVPERWKLSNYHRDPPRRETHMNITWDSLIS